jgi:hypothetical protein
VDVEAEGEEDVRRRGFRRDGVFPQRFPALDPEAAQAGGFEDAELVPAERPRMARAGRDGPDREAKAGRVGPAAAEAKASGAERRSEERAAEAERRDACRHEEHRRLVLQARVQAHVQL